MTQHKLRISFEGIYGRAMNHLRGLETIAGVGHDHFEVRECLSAFRDTILALAREETTLEEVQDFWFHNVHPATLQYESTVLEFTDPEEEKPHWIFRHLFDENGQVV